MSDRDQAGEVLPGDAEATTQENDDPPFVPAAQVDILKEHLQRHERSLAARMARVLSKVQRIAKDATAPHAMGGFKYVKEPDVYDAVRPLLAEEGIATTFNVEDWEVFQAGQKGDGKPVWAMKGLARLTFHANGETLDSTLPMFAIDYGDKAGQKLASNAEKYLVLKTFLIATGEDDAEAHDVETGFRPNPVRRDNGAKGVEVLITPKDEPNELQAGYLENLKAKKLNDGSYLVTVPRRRANEMVKTISWAEVKLAQEAGFQTAGKTAAKRGTPTKVK